MAGKKTKGRQKIEMRKIENEDTRLIAFSKRRSGIYKKASELVILTGAEIGIVVFSPSGKPFSFGHPSVEAVANRFLGGNNRPPRNSNTTTHPLVEAHRQVKIDELNQVHKELLQKLDEEKERAKVLKQMSSSKGKKERQLWWWWETPVEELNMQELLQMNAAFDELHRNAVAILNEKTAAATAGPTYPLDGSYTMNPNQQDYFDPSRAYPFPLSRGQF